MAHAFETLLQWKQAHPNVNVLAFEANYEKSFGFGKNEGVCGFCLASFHFDEKEPEVCRFCRAPIRETEVISDLAEIAMRRYSLSNPASSPRALKEKYGGMYIVRKSVKSNGHIARP